MKSRPGKNLDLFASSYPSLRDHHMHLYCDLGNYTAYVHHFLFANILLNTIKSTLTTVAVNPTWRWSRYFGHKMKQILRSQASNKLF